MSSKLTLLKNLIENKEFEKAYSHRDEFKFDNKSVYCHLSQFNFGLALLGIENDLFEELNDENFKSSKKAKVQNKNQSIHISNIKSKSASIEFNKNSYINKEIRYDPPYDPYNVSSSPDNYCGACMESPCMCSDPW